MGSLLTTMVDWCVAPGPRRLLKTLYLRASVKPLKENLVLKGKHEGSRRCFVIGNGPSLKGMDLRPLKHEITIGANSFYKHEHAQEVGLDYLCIGDPTFMVNEPRAVAWHGEIAARLPNTTLMLHENARALVAEHGLYRGHNVHYFSGAEAVAERAKDINLDMSLPLNIGMSTGTRVMIPLALCLGFREIYLVGFDSNWLLSQTASYHFYERHEFYPEFDSVASDGRGRKYEDELAAIHREFASHRLLKERAESLNVSIVNATAGGLVDVYPRRAFVDVLAS